MNKFLHKAKSNKYDEFYTRLEDIELELGYYTELFNGKVVYCNCDGFLNERKSNFFVYFSQHYNALGLKGLICTVRNPNGNGEKYEYYGKEINTTPLSGDGDFRSEECVELLKKCDIVCTNPPFSLMREYIAQVMKYNKQFLIISNSNTITYKEIFPYIKDNKIWLGVTRNGTGSMWFRIPNDFPQKTGQKTIDGVRYQTIGSTCWLTNLDHKKRHEELLLSEKYNADEYPKYDNYDAIEVSRITNIPYDYDGVMGVPITFLGKYNPNQFEIIKFRKGDDDKDLSVNGKCPYFRILIKKIKK